jgi:hypothetical protein
MFEDSDLIHRYSRTDAVRDGVLIDVSATAREARFKYPMALTAAAWARCVAVPPGVACQDEAVRLWDVLTMLRFAIHGADGGAPEVRFGVHVRNDNRDGTAASGAPQGAVRAGRRSAGRATKGSPSLR